MSAEKVSTKELEEITKTLPKCNRAIVFGSSEDTEDYILFVHGLSLIEILGTLESIKMKILHEKEKQETLGMLKFMEEKIEELRDKTTH